MTKNVLRQYRDLQHEIKSIERRLSELKDMNKERVHDVVKGSSQEYPYTQHVIHVEGVNAAKRLDLIGKLERKLESRKARCLEMTLDIEDFIGSIPNSKVRTIFEYRYYNAMTWQQVAFKLSCSSEAYPRNIHDKYLEGSTI
jgi:hypothetical protein